MQIRNPVSRVEYVYNLKLAAPAWAGVGLEPLARAFGAGDGASVNAGSVVAFPGELSDTQRSDVLNSTLLAQLVSNRVHDREVEVEHWYRRYREVLENIGWVVGSFSFQHQHLEGDEIRLDASVLRVLGVLIGGAATGLTVLQNALVALETSDPEGRAITIFDGNASSGEAGNFQVSAASLDPNGAVQLALGAFHFQSSKRKRRILFVSWGRTELNLYAGAQVVRLNPTVFGTVRQAIADKLGDHVQRFVENLDF